MARYRQDEAAEVSTKDRMIGYQIKTKDHDI